MDDRGISMKQLPGGLQKSPVQLEFLIVGHLWRCCTICRGISSRDIRSCSTRPLSSMLVGEVLDDLRMKSQPRLVTRSEAKGLWWELEVSDTRNIG